MPQKIFIISLHRSATRSVSVLLGGFKLYVIHLPTEIGGVDYQAQISDKTNDLAYVCTVLDPLIKEFDAFGDVPFPCLYPELSTRLPKSKFLLGLRDPFKWLNSIRRHIGDRPFIPYEQMQYEMIAGRRENVLGAYTDQELIGGYHRHVVNAIDYFAGNNEAERLHVFNIEDQNACAGIAQFVGQKASGPLPWIR